MTKQEIEDQKAKEPVPDEDDADDDQDDADDDEADDDQDDADDGPTPPPAPKAKRFQDDHPPAKKRSQGRREQESYDDVRPALRLW